MAERTASTERSGKRRKHEEQVVESITTLPINAWSEALSCDFAPAYFKAARAKRVCVCACV